MVHYPIQTLVKAGIKNIMVVTGGPHAGDFIQVLQNGESFGVDHLEYAYREGGEGGIADALKLCEDFADGRSVTVILGDNCTDVDVSNQVNDFKKGALIFLKEVPDPHRFGVPVFDKSRKQIVKIEEKPRTPKSSYATTGLYIYDKEVFNFIRRIKPSKRGQLEITDVNNLYLKAGKLRWAELKGYWSDAGTFESLYRTSVYWARKNLGKEEEQLTIFDVK